MSSALQCDELVPRCTLCTKRRLNCSYPDSPNSNNQNESSASPGDLELRTANGDSGRSTSTRMLEMRLFHHYITDTAVTFALNPVDVHFFQNLAPRLSVSNTYLLDSIMAVSALHLAYIEADQSHFWKEIALHYQNESVSGFYKVLAFMTPENSKPAMFCSIFIMAFTTAYPCVIEGGDSHTVDPIEEVFQQRHLVAGCMILFYQQVENDTTGDMRMWLEAIMPSTHLKDPRREELKA